jgi:hypothetical protein
MLGVFPGQAALIAGNQYASQRLLHRIGDGQREVTAIREMPQAHHDLNAEKLAELDIQPPHGHSLRTASGLPPPGEPAPIPGIAGPPDTNPY